MSPPAATPGSRGISARSGAPTSSARACPPPEPNSGVRLAVVAGEGAHVLDHPGHLEVGAPGHVGHPDGHLLGGQRRRGHDQQLGPGQQARQRHLDVARPRRHVDQQVVEVAPAHVGQELLDRLGQHQPPPHEGHALVLDEEAHRDDLEGARRPAGRTDGTSTSLGWIFPSPPPRRPVDAQHAGDGEAPDVGVEDADGVTPGGQGGGQVDGHRRLADAALPAGHGQDPGREGDLRLRGPLGGLLRGPGPSGRPARRRSSRRVRTSTPVTPGRPRTRLSTSLAIWPRRGQAAMVRAMCTLTSPSSSTATSGPCPAPRCWSAARGR